MSRVTSFAAALGVAVATLIALSQPAVAHERRNVGPYQLVVGWLDEPALAGQPNSLDLRVSDTRTTPAKAIEGLDRTLKIQIFYGGLTTPATPAITARFGTPGAYNAQVVPTKDGSYRFKITGQIESLDVDQTFESGPTTFNDVQPLTPLQYPEPVPGGADLGRRLSDIQATADQTRILALAAIVIGLASIGLALRPRRGL